MTTQLTKRCTHLERCQRIYELSREPKSHMHIHRLIFSCVLINAHAKNPCRYPHTSGEPWLSLSCLHRGWQPADSGISTKGHWRSLSYHKICVDSKVCMHCSMHSAVCVHTVIHYRGYYVLKRNPWPSISLISVLSKKPLVKCCFSIRSVNMTVLWSGRKLSGCKGGLVP